MTSNQIVTRPQLTSHPLLKRSAKEITDWAYDMYEFDWLHKMGYKGEGEVIAILDGGLNRQHPDLVDLTLKDRKGYFEGQHVVYAQDFTGKGIDDDDFHSTWIHGSLSAVHNGFGVRGRCPAAKIIILKVLADGRGDLASIAKAIQKAISVGATQIIMSLGYPSFDQQVFDACQKAYEAGIWLHAAAGNDWARNPIDWPARQDNTISWGSHDRQGQRSAFSDTGEKLDLYAPGEDVLSCFGHYDYAVNSGTSMATPCGAALVACLKKPLETKLDRKMTYNDLHIIAGPL